MPQFTCSTGHLCLGWGLMEVQGYTSKGSVAARAGTFLIFREAFVGLGCSAGPGFELGARQELLLVIYVPLRGKF